MSGPTLGVSVVPSELEMRRVLCAFPAEAAVLAKPKMLPGDATVDDEIRIGVPFPAHPSNAPVVISASPDAPRLM